MPPEVQRELTHALNLGAREIERKARTAVPEETGELRGAIEVRDSLEGFHATGAIGNFARGGLEIGTNSRVGSVIARFIGVFPARRASPGWYAAFVEFGTAPRTQGRGYTTRGGRKKKSSGNTHPGSKPRPFMWPAYYSLRRRVRGRISRAVRKGVRAAALK